MNLTKCILRNNPTNAPIYVNTTSFTLSQSYMFQPSSGHHLQGVLVHFMSRVNKIDFQMLISDKGAACYASRSSSTVIKGQRVIRHVAVQLLLKGSVLYVT
jgi:hypothetical protein